MKVSLIFCHQYECLRPQIISVCYKNDTLKPNLNSVSIFAELQFLSVKRSLKHVILFTTARPHSHMSK
jgi:hypothetical protein